MDTEIAITLFWILGFAGGISLGAILSANDDGIHCPTCWFIYLITSIVVLILSLIRM
ncbi:MAG: hypothetical protein KAJ14_05175 [Candidatus Omnitrophica bacterium]|nr:hypothetical protein [Candidatus Omnitrophota bacterium]